MKLGANAKLLSVSPVSLIGNRAGEDDAERLLRNDAVDRDPHGSTVAVLRTWPVSSNMLICSRRLDRAALPFDHGRLFGHHLRHLARSHVGPAHLCGDRLFEVAFLKLGADRLELLLDGHGVDGGPQLRPLEEMLFLRLRTPDRKGDGADIDLAAGVPGKRRGACVLGLLLPMPTACASR